MGVRRECQCQSRRARTCPVPVMLLLAFCGLLVLLPQSEQLSITEFAVPSYARAGENAELQCRYRVEAGDPAPRGVLYVKWWWRPRAEPLARRALYQHIYGHAPQLVYVAHPTLEVKDNDTIELLNLQPEDSGVYECEVYDLNEARRQHELIVYTPGTGPLLTVSEVEVDEEQPGDDLADEDLVLITCEASGVAPEPELSITVDGKDLEANASSVLDLDDTYSVYSNVSVSRESALGADIRCELFFKNADIVHEAYVNTTTFVDADAEPPTTEPPESPTEGGDTTDSPLVDSSIAHSPWLLLMAMAVSVHLLSMA